MTFSLEKNEEIDSRIVQHPSYALRQVSRVAHRDAQETREIIDELKAAVIKSNLRGLSAPQLGVPLRICAVNFSYVQSSPIVLINPVITDRSDREFLSRETCASFLGERSIVFRNEFVKVLFEDEIGDCIVQEFTGVSAAIVQHEIDHLDGILMYDRMTQFLRNPETSNENT